MRESVLMPRMNPIIRPPLFGERRAIVGMEGDQRGFFREKVNASLLIGFMVPAIARYLVNAP